MGYICVSIFLKLAAGVKILLMGIMATLYIVMMEVTHEPVLNVFDTSNR
jgi:hypothetical protein